MSGQAAGANTQAGDERASLAADIAANPVRYLWAGIAAIAGLWMIEYTPRVPEDVYPSILLVLLPAGLLLRLRTGPILFFGVWAAGELRPYLTGPRRLAWEREANSIGAGSVSWLALLAVVYLFAVCQYQFLSSGSHVKRKEPFTTTLAGDSPTGTVFALLASLVLRAGLAVALFALLLGGADRLARAWFVVWFAHHVRWSGSLFFVAGAALLFADWLLELVRFLGLDRTAAGCFLNDVVWQSLGPSWRFVERRLPADRREA
ncbi:MAG: hypothetical protein HYZ53_18845 [Planctomycetes bacterium]|nr:hypothetical protein [Planctomycetota bacterium]